MNAECDMGARAGGICPGDNREGCFIAVYGALTCVDEGEGCLLYARCVCSGCPADWQTARILGSGLRSLKALL